MKVDRTNRVIRGYSVMSIGPAVGHGSQIDRTTLEQVVAAGNAKADGVKTRAHHPKMHDDGFGKFLGKSRNFRIEGNHARADLYLDDAAFTSPSGDWATYVLQLAESAPDSFGASVEILNVPEYGNGGKLFMRVRDLMAVAIVDSPAANPSGFFGVPQPYGVRDFEFQMEYLALSAKDKAELGSELEYVAMRRIEDNGGALPWPWER